MADNQQVTPDSSGVDRTATGAIADKGTTTEKVTTSQTTTTPEPEPKPSTTALGADGKSLANQAAEGAQGAPEAYTDWKVPDGFTIDKPVNDEAVGLFKEMGLSQESGQKLVDFYVKHTTEAANQPYEAWTTMQEKWVKEAKADPTIGPRMNEVKQTISRALDVLGDTKLAADFREAMDFTGAGNHPAFIKTFYKLAQMVTEGRHVAGKGPSAEGQKAPGQTTSAAGAMYPNLPRA